MAIKVYGCILTSNGDNNTGLTNLSLSASQDVISTAPEMTLSGQKLFLKAEYLIPCRDCVYTYSTSIVATTNSGIGIQPSSGGSVEMVPPLISNCKHVGNVKGGLFDYSRLLPNLFSCYFLIEI